jgi:rubrerythrin
MYPAFRAVAQLEEEKGALRSIHFALEAEKIHEAIYNEAKLLAATGNDVESAPVFICPVCGHTALKEAPDRCPVCGLPKAKYRQF